MDPIVYRVDEKDRLTFINSAWFIFAEQNGMHVRSAHQLLGTRLWQHVSDASARHFYAVFMAKVRQTGTPITIPFRCDSPDSVRFMEMTISRLNAKELEFRTILLRESAPPPAGPPTEKKTTSAPLIEMCLWCKNVKATRWIEPERAVRDLGLFEKPRLPMISHIICPRCDAKGLNAVIE